VLVHRQIPAFVYATPGRIMHCWAMPVGMDSAVVVAALGAHMSTGSIRLPEPPSVRENLLHRTVEDWFMYGVSKI